MNTNLRPCFSALFFCIALFSGTPATSSDTSSQNRTTSIHAGLFYPNGVDFAGYTVEQKIVDNIYGYYTFGFPSFAAVGFAYYNNYYYSGPLATAGFGIGPGFHVSLSYQIRIVEQHFAKLGVGYTTGISYNGAFPVVSYEFRF